VSSKGLGQQQPGNYYYYGGSHGGRGGEHGYASDPTHGSLREPVDLGSGGYDGNRGGGAIHVTAGTLQLDGNILADGTSEPSNHYYDGGGAGGSIWLEVGTLTGNGLVRARGGTAYRGAGGGGGG
jgi:hypothetical protein